jgi:hypothetical protein
MRMRTVGVPQTVFRKAAQGHAGREARVRAEFGQISLAAGGFDEKAVEEDAEEDAESAEDDEGPPPAVVLADEAGEEAAADGADVDGGLVKAHGAGARGLAVVVADHGHGGGVVDGFAQALGGAEEQQVVEVAREGGGHADEAPDVQAGEDGGLAADAVHDEAGEGRSKSVSPGEGGAEQAELDAVQMHFFFEQGKDGENGLAVGIIEERNPPEHADHVPLIVRALTQVHP